MMRRAMRKYITRPVTSTSVATKGADEVAGSAPTRRRTNGNIDPEREPQSTTPTSAKPTVNATSGQCGPYSSRWKYFSPMMDHSATRKIPIAPRIAPNEKPARISRPATRHQSRSVTSPSAMARTISVEACDPELPPLEIINGKNNANTTALAISSWKLAIAVAVNISPKNKTTNQPARLRIIFQIEMRMYGSSSASMPPNF